MIRTFTKRTLALVLTVVMLVSCWVFVAPTQSTAATAGNYYVEIDITITNKDSYNNEFVGPYFFNKDHVGLDDMGGIVLFYKENNGTKDEDGTITSYQQIIKILL